MGSRGAFKNVNIGDFGFVKGGQTFHCIGEIDGIKVLLRDKNLAVKAPEYSHTPGRKYAIIQEGRLKHVAYYDENHKQAISIDLMHKHDNLLPHQHIYLNHTTGLPISKEQQALVNKIRRRFNLK